ncbi:MAG: hypothetical protein IT443_03415 [Phycisphaeraceae bacterium]|nr:hypothetical protein [Phycisphaeraceae bacterium]
MMDSLPTRPPPAMPAPHRRLFLPQSGRERLAGWLWSCVGRQIFRWTPVWLNPLRVVLLRAFGAKVHRSVFIHQTVRVNRPWNLTLRAGVVIHHRVVFDCFGPIEVGRDSRVSQYSHLCSGTHDYQRPDMQIMARSITIGDRVWLAADVYVNAGVTIGRKTIVGARSSVFIDLPENVIALGGPARVIRSRPEDVTSTVGNG